MISEGGPLRPFNLFEATFANDTAMPYTAVMPRPMALLSYAGRTAGMAAEDDGGRQKDRAA